MTGIKLREHQRQVTIVTREKNRFPSSRHAGFERAHCRTRCAARNQLVSGAAAERARASGASAAGETVIRPARRADLDQVIEIDATVTGLEKRRYWLDVFRRYGGGADQGRCFLVAVRDRRVLGFVIGEIRDWEFGSPPCGWVFAIDVQPRARQQGIGAMLLKAIGDAFRSQGVDTLRTMLARDNTLIMSFFRSQGMMAGPLLMLEMDLHEDLGR
ncbi:MAG TPA: GNAT family N-acetyltransferase [Burkholderiaceae bacterium]|nr:GNAT family N-acetyltransferase [Burkholderiaceae bacterium]